MCETQKEHDRTLTEQLQGTKNTSLLEKTHLKSKIFCSVPLQRTVQIQKMFTVKEGGTFTARLEKTAWKVSFIP